MEYVYIVLVIVGIFAALYCLHLIFRRLFPGFEWRLLVCVVPVILSAWPTAVAIKKQNDPTATGERLHPGVDLAGGSILVYEVDPSFWERQDDSFRKNFNADQL